MPTGPTQPTSPTTGRFAISSPPLRLSRGASTCSSIAPARSRAPVPASPRRRWRGPGTTTTQSTLRARYLLTQATLPMILASQGQIVFVNSSVGGRAPGPGLGQYAATQHALRAIADSLRAEVNPQGVRVLSVFPGRTATPMQARLCELEGKGLQSRAPDPQPEDIASTVIHALTLPRTAEITEISIRPFVSPPSLDDRRRDSRGWPCDAASTPRLVEGNLSGPRPPGDGLPRRANEARGMLGAARRHPTREDRRDRARKRATRPP